MSDLIDRQAAINAVNDVLSHYIPLFRNDQEGIPLKCARAIMDLPSAEPERKTGKWINNSPLTMKCDQCGYVISDWKWHESNFCPNCGADMRGEEDE